VAFGDAGYQGVEKREEHLETPVVWHTAMRPGKRRALDKSPEAEQQEWLEQAKASIRAKVCLRMSSLEQDGYLVSFVSDEMGVVHSWQL
jgi:IS5 family transposase